MNDMSVQLMVAVFEDGPAAEVALKPGRGIVAVVESDGVGAVTAVLEQQQADLLITDISADLAQQR